METISKINNIKYIKNLGKFKEVTKKIILSLKNTERSFFVEDTKIVRSLIKYQSNEVSTHLDNFLQ